jgi:hypothetical protein
MISVMTDAQEAQETYPSSCWASLLRGLVPLGRLVTPSAPVDPAVEIGLPQATLRKDTSMISAYYLSFYE